jgi:hypothetical protein
MDTLKTKLISEIQETRGKFLALLEATPESDYSLPTRNPAWTVGELLFHITLGPHALAFEIWMILHARGLFQFGLNTLPFKLFNRVNARFARRGARITRLGLIKAYGKAHTVIRSRLRRTREEDFQKSVSYPAALEASLAGEVTVERLFHYVKEHFAAHAVQMGVRENHLEGENKSSHATIDR